MPANTQPRSRKILAIVGFPLLVAAVLIPVIVFRQEIWRLFTSVERLQEWVAASGPVAPLVFIAIQVIQVVVFVIPGEIAQIAGGYLFGTWLGALYSVAGILIGSAIDFFLARLLGVPFVNALFSAEKVQKTRTLLDSRGSKTIFFLLFLIPGIPKDVLCYVAGLSPLRFRFFILASTAGRLPGVIGSALIGNSAADRRWILAGSILAAAVVLFAAGFFLRDRIGKWLRIIAARRGGSSQDRDRQ
jgi:uncharacterized membrane protein YdjX (TVP38/TMEM64 family)